MCCGSRRHAVLPSDGDFFRWNAGRLTPPTIDAKGGQPSPRSGRACQVAESFATNFFGVERFNSTHMHASDEIGPFPIRAEFPLPLLVQYAEAFIEARTVASRSMMVFELRQPEEGSPRSWRFLVLVTCDPSRPGRPITLLRRTLRRGLRIPLPKNPWKNGTLWDVFSAMAAAEETVWFLPDNWPVGGAVFVRWPAHDPDLDRILKFNQPSRRPLFVMTSATFLTRDLPQDGSLPGSSKQESTQIAMHFSVPSPARLRRFLRPKPSFAPR